MRYKDIVAHFGHHDQIHRGSGVGGGKMAAGGGLVGSVEE